MEYDYGVKDEYFAIESRRGWQPLFLEIREKSANFSSAESKKITNKDLNRYRDVNPFDHSRIVLSRGDCGYINANLVTVQAVERNYILTQGPLPNTVSHFWAMVWEQNSKVIVMLNNIIEKNQTKCHTYWPYDPSSALDCDDVQLVVQLTEEVHKPNYILRTFKMSDKNSDEIRIVQQFHYTTWPDFGVPATPSDFLQFLEDVRQTGGLTSGTPEEPIGPAIIHCSAGIGRSGTFCIVDTALLLLERGQRVDVKDLVLEMRRYRMGLIQTAEQLRFSYMSIIQGAQSMKYDLRSGVCHDTISLESSEDSGQSDESISAEEVEEEDDVISTGSPNYCQVVSPHGVSSSNEIKNIIEEDEAPPPIPPRSESLVSPSLVDRPLPPRPKRPHEDMEPPSTASDSEEEPDESNSVDDASGSEFERKRRKQTPEILARTAESETGNLRQRRQDRVEKTQQLITNIKEKQKELEKKAAKRHTLTASTKWLGIGVGIFVLVCVGFRYLQA